MGGLDLRYLSLQQPLFTALQPYNDNHAYTCSLISCKPLGCQSACCWKSTLAMLIHCHANSFPVQEKPSFILRGLEFRNSGLGFAGHSWNCKNMFPQALNSHRKFLQTRTFTRPPPPNILFQIPSVPVRMAP